MSLFRQSLRPNRCIVSLSKRTNVTMIPSFTQRGVCVNIVTKGDRSHYRLRSQNHFNQDLAAFIPSHQRYNMVTVTKTSTSSPNVEMSQTVSSKSSSSTMKNDSDNDNHSQTLASIQDNNSVIITPSAIQQIHHLAKKRRPDDPSIVFLRVYVDAGGCSGFQYKFELEQKDNVDTPIDPDEDVIFQVSLSDGSLPCTVVIDNGSLEYIQGSTIDFVREMVKSSFAVVDNPQSESACGCGSSFALKNFEQNPALD